MEYTKHKTRSDDGDDDKTSTLTDPPPKSESYRTGIRLRVISQEPFGIEFHWIGVGGWVV